ncbi:MAG: GGDEF domain-containing protein [Thermodesulfovibrio sp.]|nr:GGDEF domain-containing protein [Thermodesulfovibrio sp.]
MKISEILEKYNEKIILYFSKLSNTGLVLIDKKGKILDCNRGFLELVGLKDKPINHNINNLLSKNSEKISFPENVFSKLNLLFDVLGEAEILIKGYIFPCDELYLLVFEQHRLTYNELIVKMSKLNDQIVNITRELEKKNAQLKEALSTVKRMMNTDPLTGVFNRRAIDKMIGREISLALRHKIPLSVVMIDIDFFKKINDTYGHEKGDYVLKSFANKIKKLIRKEDIFGRYGGEEFILILPNTKIDNAYQASERIRQKIEKMNLKGIQGNITASFGLTEILPTDNENSLIKRADEALYLAKRRGRNRCEIL